MMRHIRTIINEIKTGNNIDLYLIIIISIAVAIGGAAQVVNFGVIASAILAILGLLAGSLLANRRTNTELKDAITQLKQDFEELRSKTQAKYSISELLLEQYPNIQDELNSAKRISVLGINLATTVRDYYSEFTDILLRGGTLRILTVDPTEKYVVSLLAFRSTTFNQPDQMNDVMKTELHRVVSLEKTAKDSGSFQLKKLAHIPSHGLIIIENASGKSVGYVKMYTFRSAGKTPVFKLTVEDDMVWFNFFKNQFEQIWALAEPIEQG